jgi:hypothetical protein
MASVIKAGNATDGVQVTSDNTGILELKTGTGSGTTALTVDASQNAGLGVTPSAWSGVGAALQVGTSAAIIGNNANSSSFISNAYFDGTNYRYIGTGFATRFATTSGVYSWNQAASGTAGNTITFTTAMTLDASGNLGLGVTPSAWGSATRAYEGFFSSNYSFNTDRVQGGIATNARSTATAGSGDTWAYRYTGFGATRYAADHTGHFWYTAPSGTAGNAITFTQAMTLDASGNFLVGTTTPSSIAASGRGLIEVNGSSDSAFAMKAGGTLYGYLFASAGEFRIANITANPLTFFTNNTERARIDASGFTQFSSNLVMPYQGAPTSKAAAATLTGAELITGILNTTGTTYTITLPTGTNIEGALTWSANNVCLDWYVINTASGTITIGANGNTTLGSLTIATGTSAQFRIRRTAANTFTVYRL